MPLFTYSGDDGRYYPELGLTVANGDQVELDQAPDDGRFSPAGAAEPPVEPPAPQPVATEAVTSEQSE